MEWREERRRDRQKKRWEDNTKEWTGRLELANSQRAVEKRERWREERAGCKAVSGDPTIRSG